MLSMRTLLPDLLPVGNIRSPSGPWLRYTDREQQCGSPRSRDMPRTSGKTPKDSTAHLGFASRACGIWLAADKRRNHMDAAESRHVVLGLDFLKDISDRLEEHRTKLPTIKEDLDDAMTALGRDNPRPKGVLSKDDAASGSRQTSPRRTRRPHRRQQFHRHGRGRESRPIHHSVLRSGLPRRPGASPEGPHPLHKPHPRPCLRTWPHGHAEETTRRTSRRQPWLLPRQHHKRVPQLNAHAIQRLRPAR